MASDGTTDGRNGFRPVLAVGIITRMASSTPLGPEGVDELSLPDEFLIMMHRKGRLYSVPGAALGCAAAELAELALLGRVATPPHRKWRVRGYQVYNTRGRVRLLSTAPTGRPWADEVLAELAHASSSDGEPPRVGDWLSRRGDTALGLRRNALIARGLLLPDPEEGDHYAPETSVYDTVGHRLRDAVEGGGPLEARTLMLVGLLQGAGRTVLMTIRQRFDRARGIGAVAAVPEALRDTSKVLSARVHAGSRGSSGGAGGDDGGDGE